MNYHKVIIVDTVTGLNANVVEQYLELGAEILSVSVVGNTVVFVLKGPKKK